MHKYDHRKSVSNQIIGQSSLIVLVGILLIGIAGSFQIRNVIALQLEADVQRLSNVGKNSLILPIWKYDQSSIDSICESFFIKSDLPSFRVIKVVLKDSSGEPLFLRNLYDEGAFEANLTDIKETQEIAIIREGETIAHLQFWLDSSPVKEFYFKTLGFLVGALAIVVVIFITANYMMFSRLVRLPFERLLNTANEAFKGNFTHNPDESKPTEFGVLARAFNKTFEAIKEKDGRILQYTQSLEQIVDEKSKELDVERMKNVQAAKLTMLGEFAGQIAHEINNPLAVIQGRAQMVLKKMPEGPSDQRTSMEKILGMTVRISKIIKGVKIFARDGGGDPIAMFSTEDFLSTVQDMISHKIQKGNIELKLKNEVKSQVIMGREVQITQIIVNLINNSCDAIESLDDRWVEVWLRDADGKAYISVTDSGGGIPIEIRKRMLDPFFTTKPVGVGTGLGLSISRQIAQQHNGELFYDETCMNTRFTLVLPLDIASQGAA